MQTPNRSRFYTLRKPQTDDPVPQSTSLPITPHKLNDASSFARIDSSLNASHVNATWPPRALRVPETEYGSKEERTGEDQLTPTKKGRGGSQGDLLVPDEEERGTIFMEKKKMEKKKIATRYVKVEGIDKHSSEKDLRYALIVSSMSLVLALRSSF